jgi:putative membrane protein
MSELPSALAGIVAVLHLAIAAGEIFAGRRLLITRFGFSAPEAEKAAPIVANAGLYNGFVAGLLFWALDLPSEQGAPTIAVTLGFVVLAGLFGALTLRKPLALLVQSVPAAAALVALWL